MKISKDYEKHVYCLEGDWEKDLRKKLSIKLQLQYLKECYNLDFIHRNCPTTDSFNHYLKEYRKKRYDKYTILYLACHGKQGKLLLGKDTISLSEFVDVNCGLFTNKIIHFGSCSSLDINVKDLSKYVKKTKALCISGYKCEIDFNKSTIMDVLYFMKLQEYKDIRCIERAMKKEYKEMVKDLEFIMVYD